HKVLSVVFQRKVGREKLEAVGSVTEYSYPKAIIKVPRKESSRRAAQLLEDFPVADLNIEEPPIENIIREVFTGKDVA
ncbi:unnamed protein product, partial [marine sediment metagenome]